LEIDSPTCDTPNRACRTGLKVEQPGNEGDGKASQGGKVRTDMQESGAADTMGCRTEGLTDCGGRKY